MCYKKKYSKEREGWLDAQKEAKVKLREKLFGVLIVNVLRYAFFYLTNPFIFQMQGWIKTGSRYTYHR